jgi:type I restriction enzyme R subunit
MPGPDNDIRAAFAGFWSDERDRARADLCAKENLDPAGVERLIRTIVFTGKRPMADAIVAAMNTKPGILQRRAAIERVVSGIEAVIATYDEGIGDLED